MLFGRHANACIGHSKPNHLLGYTQDGVIGGPTLGSQTYPNFHLADYFYDRDYFSGVAFGFIEVTATRADLGRPPAPLPASFGESH